MTTPDTSNAAIIAANLVALRSRLRRALDTASFSCAAMKAGNQNLAVGSILQLERHLPECEALYRTVVMLHRSHDNFEQNVVRS